MYRLGPANTSNNTEYNIISLPNTTVATSLTTRREIGLEYLLYGGGSYGTQPISEWTDPIPCSHIASASFQDSNVVYTYYQVNDTNIAELQYNLDSGIWEVDLGSLSIAVAEG